MVIPPGQLSEIFIGTKNTVMAAVKLGTNKEIGIIYGGGYELDEAKSVSVALPYLYATEEEAIAKLIDKNVDYTVKPPINELKSLELDKANQIIEKYKKEVEELKKELKNKLEGKGTSASDTEEDESFKNLRKEFETLKIEHKKVIDENTEYIGYRNKFNDLQKEVKNTYIQKAKTDIIKIEKLEAENKNLKEGIENALKQIEDMKLDFNAACKKFNLNKKDGEWIQE
jgi:ribosomal protein S13